MNHFGGEESRRQISDTYLIIFHKFQNIVKFLNYRVSQYSCLWCMIEHQVHN